MNKLIFISILILFSNMISAQNATEIVKKADEKMQGESSYTEMTMTIVRPTWQRTISFKSWSKSTELALTLITAPAKEKGQSFLKRGNDMWNWNPTISRMIKLPASMMSQGWMGSDYSNDDLLKESSIVKDFNHTLAGSETIAGKDCYKIILMPKEDATVVWGKMIMWISKDGYLQLKIEYFDEDMELVKTEIGSEIKMMDGREIPTQFELIPADSKGNKTIVVLNKILYNIEIKDDFFSQQNMQKIK